MITLNISFLVFLNIGKRQVCDQLIGHIHFSYIIAKFILKNVGIVL